MVLHMVTLLKLHLQLTKPAVAGVSTSIICVLKLLMGFRFFKDEALYQSRLFLFRLGQIAFNSEPQISNLARMERAFRLIFPTHVPVTPSINSISSQEDHELQNEREEMFYSLSMLAL
ncbi:Protein arginine N-methyltransferase 7 [Trifolium repens]|nr:Protein arginine N-methyltransferase 7 [Trifolium repens]